MNIKFFTCFFLATVTLFGEITTYSEEKQEALDRHAILWKEPDFRIDQHEHFVHKTIDRVILAVNEKTLYLQYWKRVARAWTRFVGVKPTLIYIGKGEVPFSDELGEVIHIPPVAGVPTAFQSQCVRLLAPALFPEDICLISDLDQFPLNAEFFHRPFDELGEDAFVIYELLPNRRKRAERIEFRMSYNAAKGKVFGEIFGVNNIAEIRQTLKNWYQDYYKQYRFYTDQRMLFKYVSNWDKFDTHCYQLGRHHLAYSLSQEMFVNRGHLQKLPKNDTKFQLALTPQFIKDCWKGRYADLYLDKGNTPFNQLLYRTFGLDFDE